MLGGTKNEQKYLANLIFLTKNSTPHVDIGLFNTDVDMPVCVHMHVCVGTLRLGEDPRNSPKEGDSKIADAYL